MFKFNIGDKVYVRGRSQESQLTITDRFLHDSGFPHYIVRDSRRKLWRVPQLQVHTKKLPKRDD